MEQSQQTDNHETLKVSTSSDPHHFPKTVLIGLGAFLLMIIGGGIGYYLGTNNKPIILNNALIDNQILSPTPTLTEGQKAISAPKEELITNMKTLTLRRLQFDIPSS